MSVTSEIKDGLSTLRDFVEEVQTRSSNSLTAFSKKSMIISRVYVDDTLAGEDVLKDVMSVSLDLYCSFIMTAMNMNMYVTDTTKVRNIVSTISTESFDETDKPVFVSELVSGYFGDFAQAPKGALSKKMAHDFDDSISRTEQQLGISHPQNNEERNEKPNSTTISSKPDREDKHSKDDRNSVNDLKYVKDEGPIAVGRVLKCDFRVGGNSIPIFLHVQLNPRYIPNDVIRQFVKASCPLSFRQRWMQMSAGEISFLKDLIMGCDLRRERRDSMKKDKTGVLRELFAKQTESLVKTIGNITQTSPSSNSNIANSVLLFEKNNFIKACSASSVKFSTYSSRQRFFDNTFCIMVIVVDVMYNKVEIYYNGIDSFSVFTFDQLKKKQKIEGSDIVNMMRSYASSTAPKF